MSLNAGKLRHRVRIEQFGIVNDSHGDAEQGATTGSIMRAWTLLATVWAAIEPLSAREFVAANEKTSKVTTRITIRYRSDVTAAMRVVHGSKLYNIEGVLSDKESGLEYLTLPCSEGVSDGQ